MDHSAAQTDSIGWLLQRAMLRRGEEIAAGYSGTGKLWRRPFAETQPRAAATTASVWLAVYPASIVTRPASSNTRPSTMTVWTSGPLQL